MIISDFINPELDYFHQNCDFTDEELIVFELRSKNKSLKEIATSLNLPIDKIKKISCRVNKKIINVL